LGVTYKKKFFSSGGKPRVSVWLQNKFQKIKLRTGVFGYFFGCLAIWAAAAHGLLVEERERRLEYKPIVYRVLAKSVCEWLVGVVNKS